MSYIIRGVVFFFFFKQKTAYEMRISDWSSDVCSSDLAGHPRLRKPLQHPGERDRRALPVTVPARRACIRARSWQKWQCPKTDKGRLAAALVVESMASPRGFEPRCPP